MPAGIKGICRDSFLHGRFWSKFLLPQLRLFLALENSPDFNSACTPAISILMGAISAWSAHLCCSPSARRGCRFRCLSVFARARCPQQSSSSMNCEVFYVIDEIAKDNENDQSNQRVTLLCVLHLALTSCKRVGRLAAVPVSPSAHARGKTHHGHCRTSPAHSSTRTTRTS
jgi:hypothetical protein